MTTRRFELGGFLGSAFEVDLDGATLVLRTSKDGGRGRDVRRTLVTPEAAAAEAERLIAAHVAKGYVAAVAYTPGPTATTAKERNDRAAIEALRNEAVERAAAQDRLEVLRAATTYARDESLERQCRAAPDDPTPWSVYADFLLERGDPRGEFATDPAKRDAIIATHGPRLCGSEHAFDLELQHGFVVGATIKPATRNDLDLESIAGGFFNAPMATFISSLRFGLAGFGGDNTWRKTVEAIVASPIAAHLRVLRLDAYDYDDCMMHWVNCGDFGDLFAELPALEELRVRGDALAFRALPPTLRTYVREGCSTKTAEVKALAARAWPVLEHLEIWFGQRDYGATGSVDDLAPILEARDAPRLVHLGIVNSELAAELVPALATSRLLPQLHSLDLRMGTFGGAAAVGALVTYARAFRHLASIDLSQNLLTDAEVERVRGVLDNVIVVGQRDLPEEDEGQRYVAEYE